MLPKQTASPLSSLINKLPDDCLEILEAQVSFFKQLSNNGFYNDAHHNKTSSFIKDLLFNSLLVILNQKSPMIKASIKQKIFEINTLFNYNELEACSKLLKTALKEAYEAKLFSQLDTLLDIKQKLIQHGVIKEKQRDENRLEMLKNKERLINYQHYASLSLKVAMLQNNNTSKANYKNQFKKLLTNEYLKDPKLPMSARSQSIFNIIHGLANSENKDYKKAQQYFKKVVEIYDNNAYLIEESPESTMTVYGNFINMSIAARQYDCALEGIQKLQNILSRDTYFIHQDLHFDFQLRSFSQKIAIYTAQNHHAKVIQQIPYLKKYLKKGPTPFRALYQQSTIRCIARAYQALEQREKAFEWWTLLEEYEHPSLNNYTQTIGRIQKIILLIDQRNKALLLETLEKTKLYYKKYKVKGKYENLFLAMADAIAKQPSFECPQTHQIFQEYLPLFESFIEAGNSNIFDYRISVINWTKKNTFCKK